MLSSCLPFSPSSPVPLSTSPAFLPALRLLRSIVQEAIAALDSPPRLLDTNPMSLQAVIADLKRLGAELGRAAAGEAAAAALTARVDAAVATAQRLAAEAPGGAAKKRVGLGGREGGGLFRSQEELCGPC